MDSCIDSSLFQVYFFFHVIKQLRWWAYDYIIQTNKCKIPFFFSKATIIIKTFFHIFVSYEYYGSILCYFFHFQPFFTRFTSSWICPFSHVLAYCFNKIWISLLKLLFYMGKKIVTFHQWKGFLSTNYLWRLQTNTLLWLSI